MDGHLSWLKLFLPSDHRPSCSKPPEMLHTDRCSSRFPITVSVNKNPAEKLGQFDSSECHVKVVLTVCSFCCCDQQESLHLTCVMCSRWTNWHLPAVNLMFLPHLCHVCKVLLLFIGLCVFSGSSDWSRVDIQSHAAGGWVHSLTHSLSTNTSGFLKKSPSGQNKTFPPVIHWAKYWERSVVFARPLLDLLLLQSGAAWEVTAARPHDRSHSDNPLLYRVA